MLIKAIRQLAINNPPLLRRIFVCLYRCGNGRIASYVTVTTTVKTDKKASKMGGLLIANCLSISILLLSSFTVYSAELTHKFINPNFGGSPFNAGPLLSNAAAQNDYKEPVDSAANNSAESFRERLDRSILSRLSRILVDNAFDEEGKFVEVTIETGLNSINVEEVESGGSLVTITNNETGQTTVIEVPGF